jgi:Bacteriophage A118-like holin, Hol118
MEQVLLFATLLLPVVTAMVEMVKNTINLRKNFVPVISLVLGLGLAAVAYPFTELPLDLRLWAGAFAGLASTGLFELALNPRQGSTKE